jgi:hypothetical protein
VNVQVFWKFSHENHVYQLLFGIGTLLSISYDEYRRTKKGRPRGGSVTKNLKMLLPAVLRRSPEAGGPSQKKPIFMVPV